MNTLQYQYEHDINSWISQHIALLKAKKFDELDVEHLIEELEDMGKSNVRELESRLIVLIAHLLKWQFQLAMLSEQWQEFEGKSWRKTIIEQRSQLLDLFEEIPSLKQKIQSAITKTYPKAVTFVVDETGLPKKTFPSSCPYCVERVLDKTFYPDSKL